MFALAGYNLGISIKSNIQCLLYVKTIITFGTSEKHREFAQKAYSLEHLGCFALT